MKKLIIFDLDGTLYDFGSENFGSSKLYKEVQKNIISFISKKLNVSLEEAQKIYCEIDRDFNNHTSFGMKIRYGVDRKEYFSETWNIDPSGMIEKKDMLPLMKSFNAEIRILTSAPSIWASKVLDHLNLSEYKSTMTTGDSELLKPDPLVFKKICDESQISPDLTISVGDQLHTDILPAKSLGIKTVLIRSNSEHADYCITDLEQLKEIVK